MPALLREFSLAASASNFASSTKFNFLSMSSGVLFFSFLFSAFFRLCMKQYLPCARACCCAKGNYLSRGGSRTNIGLRMCVKMGDKKSDLGIRNVALKQVTRT